MLRPYIRSLLIFPFIFFAAALFLFRANAHATEEIKAPCPQLGVTTLAADKASIIACVLKTPSALSGATCENAGGCIWKSMTGGQDGVPSGTIAFFALAGCPEGWALTDGNNKTVDLRGEFLRVWDAGKGVDNGRSLGSRQGDAIRNITGTFGHDDQFAWNGYTGAFASNGSASYGASNISREYGASVKFDANLVVPTANENRPRNIALLACQKL